MITLTVVGVLTLIFLYLVLVSLLFGSKMLEWSGNKFVKESRFIQSSFMDAVYGHGNQATVVQIRRARLAQTGLKVVGKLTLK